MLYYIDVQLSGAEVPGENSVCIYISECSQQCKNCHSPELQNGCHGDLLCDNIEILLDVYFYHATCVCFLGEGRSSKMERDELTRYSHYAHKRALKTCLYSGRDTCIEEWMKTFDYIKLGAFDEKLGGLMEEITNQIMYKKIDGEYRNITKEFHLNNI